MPLVEKYRPFDLEDIVSHKDIISTCTFSFSILVKKFVEQRRLPHLLFHGPPGTGKTSSILALSKKIYGKNFRSMTLEVEKF